MKKKTIAMFIICLILLIGVIISIYIINKKNQLAKEHELTLQKQEQLLAEIKGKYNKLVKTNKEAKLFSNLDGQYVESGRIGDKIELTLEDMPNITLETKYFKIKDKEYYIHYDDIDKIEKLSKKDDRYKRYIPFNENIVTKDTTTFYNESGLAYTFNKSFNLPILIKEENKYYVEFEGQLLSVKKEDVIRVEVVDNSKAETLKSVSVVAYHFFYDKKAGEVCDETICHTTDQFESHLKYLKDNNYLTMTMKELDLFIDGNIKLPKKSVVITIDDGAMGVSNKAIPLLEKYDLHATLFLITAWFKKQDFISPNLEIHSHGDNLHNPGICPGGQGGAIKCLDKEELLKDLAKARSILDNTTIFCYPFYEYNDYAISVLKEAGFTMAFRGGETKVKPGVDKFKIPRFTFYGSTTLSQFIATIS
ncbi:MAG: polysaccharide deacetylase family protein [Clostridia bacterium]|nr:polysaccharide deacetylase family protein [Clostridia bacterium]